MQLRKVFLGIVAVVFVGLVAACASTGSNTQDIADYQNLLQRADRLAKTNQELDQAINLMEEQIAVLKQQLEDTRNLTSTQGDPQKKLVDLAKARDNLQLQLLDVQRELAKMKAADIVVSQRRKDALNQLKVAMQPEITTKAVIIRDFNGVILIEVTANITFSADSSKLKPEFERVLLKLAAIFKTLPEKIIRIEGHTATFENDRENNSWELGADRAIKVTRFMQTTGGLDPERIVVVSYGHYWPDSPNDTEAERVVNRVVSFALLDRSFYNLNELQRISVR